MSGSGWYSAVRSKQLSSGLYRLWLLVMQSNNKIMLLMHKLSHHSVSIAVMQNVPIIPAH